MPSGAVGIVQEDGESGAVSLQLEVLLSRSHAVHIAIHRQYPEGILLPVFHLNHVGQVAQQHILAVSVVSVHAAHLAGQHMLLVLHQHRQRVSVCYLVQFIPGIDIQSLCRGSHDVSLLRAVHVPAGLAYLRQLPECVPILQEEPLQGTHHQRAGVHTFYRSNLSLNAICIRVSGQLMHPLNHEDTVRGSAPDVPSFLVPAQLAHVVAAQTVPGRERLQHLAVLQEHQSLVLQAVDGYSVYGGIVVHIVSVPFYFFLRGEESRISVLHHLLVLLHGIGIALGGMEVDSAELVLGYLVHLAHISADGVVHHGDHLHPVVLFHEVAQHIESTEPHRALVVHVQTQHTVHVRGVEHIPGRVVVDYHPFEVGHIHAPLPVHQHIKVSVVCSIFLVQKVPEDGQSLAVPMGSQVLLCHHPRAAHQQKQYRKYLLHRLLV